VTRPFSRQSAKPANETTSASLRYGSRVNGDGGWAAKDVVTTVLSSTAIVVSALSIGWQYVRSRFDRPRLHLMGGTTRKGPPNAAADWSFKIEVSNYGERPVTIVDAYWDIGPQLGAGMRLKPTEGPKLPLRLDAYDLVTWDIGPIPVGMVEGLREAQPWIEVVDRPTWKQRRRGLGGHRLMGERVHSLDR
jgi:hypothetical protein